MKYLLPSLRTLVFPLKFFLSSFFFCKNNVFTRNNDLKKKLLALLSKDESYEFRPLYININLSSFTSWIYLFVFHFKILVLIVSS